LEDGGCTTITKIEKTTAQKTRTNIGKAVWNGCFSDIFYQFGKININSVSTSINSVGYIINSVSIRFEKLSFRYQFGDFPETVEKLSKHHWSNLTIHEDFGQILQKLSLDSDIHDM